MTVVCILTARCWDCQFGGHPAKPHTWMDSEDIEFSSTVAWPESPEEWAALAESHPCGCWCPKSVAPAALAARRAQARERREAAVHAQKLAARQTARRAAARLHRAYRNRRRNR